MPGRLGRVVAAVESAGWFAGKLATNESGFAVFAESVFETDAVGVWPPDREKCRRRHPSVCMNTPSNNVNSRYLFIGLVFDSRFIKFSLSVLGAVKIDPANTLQTAN